MIKLNKLILAIFFLFAAPPAFPATETYDDDAIKNYFAKNGEVRESHGVMAAQRERLEAILNYFLVGDFESISTHGREMSDVMRTLIVTQPSGPEEEERVWKALSEVVLQARLLAAEADRKDYRKAYEHFTNLTRQCIECHQVARSWGKFQEPIIPADKPKDKAEKTLLGVD